MKKSIKVNWEDGMCFSSDIDGHKMLMDASEEFGGENQGPRPKPLLMLALAGCTGMDIVSLLKKMRVEIEDFSIDVEGEITEEHPKQFTSLNIIYSFKGENLPMEKLKKAIDLSQEKYCGVSATLKKALSITHEIKILD